MRVHRFFLFSILQHLHRLDGAASMFSTWSTRTMSNQRNIPVRIRSFSAEDQEKLLEETILEWRALGASAAWNAIYDMVG